MINKNSIHLGPTLMLLSFPPLFSLLHLLLLLLHTSATPSHTGKTFLGLNRRNPPPESLTCRSFDASSVDSADMRDQPKVCQCQCQCQCPVSPVIRPDIYVSIDTPIILPRISGSIHHPTPLVIKRHPPARTSPRRQKHPFQSGPCETAD